MPDGTNVIIKPDTPSGHAAAQRRVDLLNQNGIDKTSIIYYNPNDSRYLPGSPTYIGPKVK